VCYLKRHHHHLVIRTSCGSCDVCGWIPGKP
jgi:hypothetical protein